jgi:hypothetical protein
MHYRGFSIGCRIVNTMIDRREIVVLLNDDARFAFPFGDGYWSLLLDRGFVYEGEIERFLRSIRRRRLWLRRWRRQFRLLVGAGVEPAVRRPSGHSIEASSANAARLTRNSELNGGRLRYCSRAVGADDRQQGLAQRCQA